MERNRVIIATPHPISSPFKNYASEMLKST